MAESLANTDDVLAKLNDNHVFADVIHGIIVEPHVAGYPDDEKQIGIHAVTPIQLKFASGQRLVRRELSDAVRRRDQPHRRCTWMGCHEGQGIRRRDGHGA